MTRIEEVEAIIYKANQSVVFDAPPHRPIRGVAEQIDQLYEPQPDQSSYNLDHDEWYEWFIGMLHRKPDIAEKNAIRHLVEARIEALIEGVRYMWPVKNCISQAYCNGWNDCKGQLKATHCKANPTSEVNK